MRVSRDHIMRTCSARGRGEASPVTSTPSSGSRGARCTRGGARAAWRRPAGAGAGPRSRRPFPRRGEGPAAGAAPPGNGPPASAQRRRGGGGGPPGPAAGRERGRPRPGRPARASRPGRCPGAPPVPGRARGQRRRRRGRRPRPGRSRATPRNEVLSDDARPHAETSDPRRHRALDSLTDVVGDLMRHHATTRERSRRSSRVRGCEARCRDTEPARGHGVEEAGRAQLDPDGNPGPAVVLEAEGSHAVQRKSSRRPGTSDHNGDRLLVSRGSCATSASCRSRRSSRLPEGHPGHGARAGQGGPGPDHGGELGSTARPRRDREPILHLIRNAVDHGVETPDRRAARRRPWRPP